jgi:hypothetical protein
MMQTSSGNYRGHQKLDGICRVVYEYAISQHPLFGNAGRLLRVMPQETVAGQVPDAM